MNSYDVIVVGAGHAGIEATLSAARMGLSVACITMRLDRIGHLPCNCSIGGPAKGHMAREVDALGGQMGVTTDYALTHIRRVGTSHGPAVQTLRAHVCKDLYPVLMQKVMLEQPGVHLIEAAVESLDYSDGALHGVILADGTRLRAKAVVLTTGTFLNGLCHQGKIQTVAARHGDQASVGLSASLASIGVRLRRFKTGTTPRIAKSSIDFSKTPPMESEPDAGTMSYLHDRSFPEADLLPCWQTKTNVRTHQIIAENLSESAMYSGQIQGIGPRYCPSIEDKIVRFADKDSHPIFLEQETWHGEEMYVQGVSTSLSAHIQQALLETVPGLENVVIMRPGYAVEYDMADPLQLDGHLMSKLMPGLFLAGQLNGTSGYEEAAGQGIVAGINAARYATDLPPVDFARSNSFIGVMVDDLVTKGVEDPYRMLTARAEHRLLLRHDNADERLTPIAREIGLCSEERWARFNRKQDLISEGQAALENLYISKAHDDLLAELDMPQVKTRTSFFDMMRRPGMNLANIERLAGHMGFELNLTQEPEARDQLELRAMYAGYVEQQRRLADNEKKLDDLKIPANWDYHTVVSLSYETREKLSRIRPATIGQASRVPGVRPTDISLLIGVLKGKIRQETASLPS